MFNQVTMLGYTGRDPELRYTKSGTPVCRFSLATNSRRKSGEEMVKTTEWFNVVVWGKRAESIAKNTSKGTLLHVIGEIQTRKYVPKGETAEKSVMEIIASKVTIVGSKEGKVGEVSDETEADAGGVPDSDIPF